MKEITETLRVPVKERVDVIVAGGGFAGVAAALAARRCGAEVLLLEKTALLGGLGTNGLISWYEPLCDGLGEQMITGIAEELLHAAIRYGDDTLPEAWREYAAGAREGGADRGRLEKDIADKAGIPEHMVCVEMPSPSVLMNKVQIGKTDVSILEPDGRVVNLTKTSPIAKSLQSRDPFGWSVVVACPPEHREAVRNAASRIIEG